MSNIVVMPLSTSEVKMLKNNNWISVSPNGAVTWTAKPHTRAGAFASVRTAARSGNLISVRGKLVTID